MKSFLTASLVLATCAAFAAVKENFDATAVDSLPASGWTGDGKVQVKTGGSADSEHSLAIDGTVTCTNSGATPSEFAKTSFLVKAPSEGTATTDLPTGDDVAGCQIAVATGEAGTGDDADKLSVMVYAKSGESAVWAGTGIMVTTGAWFTVALDFDYSAALRTATVSINGTAVGPYTLVSQPESQAVTNIASLAFVGAAEIDEVLIDEALPKSSMTDGLADLRGLTVYTNEVGMTLAEIAASTEGSGGLTAAERIQAGLTATDEAASFTATAISTDAQDKLGITVPYARDNGQVYTVVMTADGTTTRTVVSPEIGVNQATLKVNPPSGAKVIKLAVDVGAPASSN